MLLTSLLILYFILFAAFCWRRMVWGIYLIIFALPSYLIRFEFFSVPMTLLEGMILILFAVWLVKRFTIYDLRFTNQAQILNTKYLIPNNVILPTSLFLLAATISIFVVPDLRAAAGIWKAYFIEPVLFFVVFINVIKTDKQINNIIWALGLSLLIPGLLAIYQKFTGVFIPDPFWAAEATRRVTSVYGYPNAIGLYFAPIVTLFIGWFVYQLKSTVRLSLSKPGSSKHDTLRPALRRGIWQDEQAQDDKQALNQVQGDNNKWLEILVLIVLLIIAGLSIIFAQSKGAVMAIGAGILFYALFWKGLRKYFVSLLVLSGLLGFIIFPNLFSLEGAKTVTGGGSLEVRTEQWSEAWQMLKTKPIFGAGLSGYQPAVAPFHEKDYIEIFLYPHQILLTFWSEIGLLGLFAFIWLVVLFFRIGFKYYQSQITSYALPVAAAMTALLVHGLVDVPYFKNDLSVLFWILFGLMVVLWQKQKALSS